MLAALTIHLPHPGYWHLAENFNQVLGGLPTLFAISFIAAPVSDFLNIYLLVKTKILFKGKYFIVRNVTASAIGELVDTVIIGSLLTMLYHWQGHQWMIMAVIYCVKLVYAFLSSIPALIVTRILKKHEGFDANDQDTNFNPFRLRID